MFAGFTSRCAMPFLCASASASATGSSSRTVSSSERSGAPSRALLRRARSRAACPRATRGPCTARSSPALVVEHADVARLDDRRRALGEIGEERAFLDEVLEELLALVLGDLAERLEDLHGDGPLPEHVRARGRRWRSRPRRRPTRSRTSPRSSSRRGRADRRQTSRPTSVSGEREVRPSAPVTRRDERLTRGAEFPMFRPPGRLCRAGPGSSVGRAGD